MPIHINGTVSGRSLVSRLSRFLLCHKVFRHVQTVNLHAAPAVVQELPLPLCIHPSGATWLKLKAKAPQMGGLYDNHRGIFYTQQVRRRRHPSMHHLCVLALCKCSQLLSTYCSHFLHKLSVPDEACAINRWHECIYEAKPDPTRPNFAVVGNHMWVPICTHMCTGRCKCTECISIALVDNTSPDVRLHGTAAEEGYTSGNRFSQIVRDHFRGFL